MKDYARIAAKIRETPWLITPEGLSLILSIMDERISNPESRLTDAELAARLESAGSKGNNETDARVQNGVGILPIYGPIFGKANLMTQLSGATSMEAFRSDLKTMLADDSVKSILLDIDSPGGSSEMIAEAADEIFAGRDIKPIYAVANNMSGSAAYYLMSQATKGYVTPSGSVGSVGVYTVHEDQSAQDKQRGLKYTFISAAPYKTEGNPHEPLSLEGEAYRQEIVNEIYDEFLTAVARGRGIDKPTVESSYGGGRMLPSKRALAAGMVDGISEFDALLASLSTPTAPQVVLNGKRVASALTSIDAGGNLLISLDSVSDYEHSEPGTGSPPTPRQQDHVEPDVASGSRRPDLTRGIPDEDLEPGAPKASNGGNMPEEVTTLEQLFALFGVTSEADLLTAATTAHTEASALRGDVTLAAQEREFKQKYPDIYKQMQEDREKTLTRNASDFASSVKMFTKVDGEGNTQKTDFGLSALAAETVEETYLKAANGQLTLDAFTECIQAISQNGIVQYGELGSNLESELPEYSTASAEGIRNMRLLFAQKVAEIQKADKLTYPAAVAEASKRHPDLAEAYRATARA